MIVLSGGTGTPKLLNGLRKVIPDEEITVIVNTGEDLVISGNLVCPDIDTVLYLFAGMIDDSKWWGIKGDTFNTNSQLEKFGITEKLKIGDRDRAVHIMRTGFLNSGLTLTEATAKISTALGIRARILPMCDEKVDTYIMTDRGEMHFQDFWITGRGEPEVEDVDFRGIGNAGLSDAVLDVFEKEDNVIIGPSNPITSIGPILSVKGMRDLLKEKNVLAVSPIIGKNPVSGPAGKFMKAKGFEVSARGVAECYRDILDILVVDEKDYCDIEGARIAYADTLMDSEEKSVRLARTVVELGRILNNFSISYHHLP